MNQLLAGERYELNRRLGHGGMATVYLARDLKLDRDVAIKLLADNYAGDEEVRRRFSREARLAARLDHPNVVQVFDVGEEDDRPYIVMEHVDGGTLADRLNGGRTSMPEDEALRLLGQLCEGLGHAHAKNLVHRDIKPQNLLLRESDGCLKITDFGIARAAEETRLTKPGKVIGTDRYMAPEQLADGRITPAVDVYACGVVADELLPQARDPELQEIVGRCLRGDPDERFGDARSLGEALAAIEGGESAAVVRRIKSQARPTRQLRGAGATASWPNPTEEARRRRSLRVRIAVIVAALALAAGGVFAALSSNDADAPTKPDRVKQRVRPTAVPRSDDPARQAKELADFLRAQSRSPSP
jgi:hypothetical protein